MFVFVFKDMVVELHSVDGKKCYFRQTRARWGKSVVRKYWASCLGSGGWQGGQADVAMSGRMWL